MVMYFNIIVVCHKIMSFVSLPHDTPGIVDSAKEKANQVDRLDAGWFVPVHHWLTLLSYLLCLFMYRERITNEI